VPRLPVDIMFESVLRDNEVVDYNDYVSLFQKDLKEAVRIAQDSTTQAQKKEAAQYNKRVKGIALEIGDRVLLANRRERARGKLADLDAKSTVLSTLSNDGLDMEWPEKEGATQQGQLPGFKLMNKPRQDPVCSQDPPTKFFDEDLESKTDTGEPSE
ncbi:hypothetical protein M9458_007563, partial [Cirrhinus mrigala]